MLTPCHSLSSFTSESSKYIDLVIINLKAFKVFINPEKETWIKCSYYVTFNFTWETQQSHYKFLSSLQIHGCDFYQNTTTANNRVKGTMFVYSNLIFFSFHERWGKIILNRKPF